MKRSVEILLTRWSLWPGGWNIWTEGPAGLGSDQRGFAKILSNFT